MKKIKVYCIIVTYNAMKWVDKCLGSLRQSSVPVIPVIIDNCSKDETVSYVEKNYPEVHLIVNKENKGFGQANNQGIEWAYKEGATHFFLLNQDAWVQSNTIERIIEIQEKHQLAIVSPVHLNGKGDEVDFNFRAYVTADKNLNTVFFRDAILGQFKEYYVVARINAAAWMISRKTIEEIGGFDPVFFLYGEDDNYLQRLHYHGFQLAFVPDSFVYHDRIIHGDAKAFNKLELRNWLVGSYTNINIPLYTINKRRVYWHVKTFWLFAKYLFTFRFKAAFAVCGSFFSYISAWPQIVRSRKNNKKMGANWLKL